MRNKALTLIEILVVMAIIGLLASIVLVSTQGVRAKARDAKRAEELQQAQIAIEYHYYKYGDVPTPVEYGDNEGNFDYSRSDIDGDGIFFLDFLAEKGVLVSDMLDPVNSGTKTYFFSRWRDSDPCPPLDRPECYNIYSLGAGMETAKSNQIDPCVSCYGWSYSLTGKLR